MLQGKNLINRIIGLEQRTSPAFSTQRANPKRTLEPSQLHPARSLVALLKVDGHNLMGFVKTQAAIAGCQALLALFSQLVGIFLGSTDKYLVRNRILVVLMTLWYWSGPVFVILLTCSRGYDRELSEELGLRFIEETALWGVFALVVSRPVSQFFKTWFMALRFGMCRVYDPDGCQERRVQFVMRQATISAIADGTGGLFDSDWLYNWRQALEKIGTLQIAWHERLVNANRVPKEGEDELFGEMQLRFIDRPLPRLKRP